MTRSFFAPSFIIVITTFVTGCSTMDPLTSNPFDTGSSHEPNGNVDTEQVFDTGSDDADDSITEQATGLNLQWEVSDVVVPVTDVTLPRLLVNTTDVDAVYTITGMDIIVSDMNNQSWITELPDQRMAAGTTTQTLGVSSVVAAACDADEVARCSAMWSIDVANTELAVLNSSSLDFGFTMAIFTDSDADMLATIDELNDTTPDVIEIAAIVSWSGMSNVSGETVTTATFMISTTPD